MKILKSCLTIILFISGMTIITNVFAEQVVPNEKLTVVANLPKGGYCYYDQYACDSGLYCNPNTHKCE